MGPEELRTWGMETGGHCSSFSGTWGPNPTIVTLNSPCIFFVLFCPAQIRYRKDKALPKQTPCFPAITGIKDLASGGAIAATIHYYCPQLIRLEGEPLFWD